MGMSIDETIEILHGRDKCMEYVTDNDSEAFELAIDTMRKYQKIQEIVNSKTTRLSYELGFRQIRKVIEDGTD